MNHLFYHIIIFHPFIITIILSQFILFHYCHHSSILDIMYAFYKNREQTIKCSINIIQHLHDLSALYGRIVQIQKGRIMYNRYTLFHYLYPSTAHLSSTFSTQPSLNFPILHLTMNQKASSLLQQVFGLLQEPLLQVDDYWRSQPEVLPFVDFCY